VRLLGYLKKKSITMHCNMNVKIIILRRLELSLRFMSMLSCRRFWEQFQILYYRIWRNDL